MSRCVPGSRHIQKVFGIGNWKSVIENRHPVLFIIHPVGVKPPGIGAWHITVWMVKFIIANHYFLFGKKGKPIGVV